MAISLSSSDKQILRQTLDETFFIVLCCILPPLAAFADLIRLGAFLTESSIAEALQDLLLLIICIRFGIQAKKHPRHRGWLFLCLTLLVAMFIREHDSLLDLVWKGFWKVPVTLWTVSMVSWISLRHRQTIIDPMIFFLKSNACLYFCIGFPILTVLSRLYGSGTFIWNDFLIGYYAQGIKNVLQEGLELFGYLLLTRGSMKYTALLAQSP